MGRRLSITTIRINTLMVGNNAPDTPDIPDVPDTPTVTKHTVTFNANGGEGGWSRQMNYGERIIVPTVSWNGHVFSGWSSPVPDTVPDHDVTLTAQWTPIQYAIIYDMNGHGEPPMDAIYTYTVDFGGYSPSSPENVDDCTFAGWTPESIPPNTTGDFTFTANWETKSYIIVQYSVDGRFLPSVERFEVGTPINNLLKTAKVGYHLEGWFDQPEGGNNVLGTIAQHDMIVYARWTPAPMTVKWHLNDNSLTPILKTTTVLYRNEVGELPTLPNKEGYEFIGWFTAKNGGDQVTEHTVITSNVIFYARRRAIEYPITYNMNGHGSPNPMNLQAYTVETGKYTPRPAEDVEGWTFSRWSPEYIPENNVGDFVFVAIWDRYVEIQDYFGSQEFQDTLDEVNEEYPIDITPVDDEQYSEIMENLQTDPFPESHDETIEWALREDPSAVRMNWSELNPPLAEEEIQEFYDDEFLERAD